MVGIKSMGYRNFDDIIDLPSKIIVIYIYSLYSIYIYNSYNTIMPSICFLLEDHGISHHLGDP